LPLLCWEPAGVFDAAEKCLLGIISAKIREIRRTAGNGKVAEESSDVAKYFVPSAAIAEFIPPEIRQ
jgi:hypothetical protein